MAAKVYIDGSIRDPDDARISVFDRGFLYGDSVYEVMRTSGGNPVDLAAHLDRLERSGAAIALTVPPREAITEAMWATLEAADNPESYVRLIVTRGCGEIGLDTALAGDPSVIVIVKPLALPPDRFYTEGVSVRLVGVQRTPRRAVDPAVKSGNYLNNIMALLEARRSGADEALMCDAQGRVAEGSTWNLFVVKGGRVVTPALDIGLLAGITRQRVIELATGAGIPVEEGTLTPDQVRDADEAFLTSSIRAVVPIASIDGQTTRIPAVGPMTRRIVQLYAGHLAAQAQSRPAASPDRPPSL